MSEPTTHPYISGAGNITKFIQHLRGTIPPKIDAATVKKIGFASNNESYLINILRFLNVIDEAGAMTSQARKVFTQHDNDLFAKEFSALVKTAYKDLFDTVGEGAWKSDANTLITYFRQADQTSATIGSRQAGTFQTLAALAGHQELSQPRERKAPKAGNSEKPATKIKKETAKATESDLPPKQSGVGLTVRIEVNLPAGGDQETYDRIFKSIRQNLLNG